MFTRIKVHTALTEYRQSSAFTQIIESILVDFEKKKFQLFKFKHYSIQKIKLFSLK